MAKFITQETFDEAVKENMEDFDMDRESAARDAVGQFSAQGTTSLHIPCGISFHSVALDMLLCLVHSWSYDDRIRWPSGLCIGNICQACELLPSFHSSLPNVGVYPAGDRTQVF